MLKQDHRSDSAVPRTQNVSIDGRKIGNSHVTFVGVEHEAPPHSYPWHKIQQIIESLGENGKIVLEYFPPELEQTIYNHPLLGRYARWYSHNAGILHFFGGVGDIAATTQKEVIVLDPANNAPFQLLYLHMPLVAMSLGIGWAIWKRWSKQRIRWPQRLATATLLLTGLEGVSWYLQDTIRTHPFKRFYRDHALNMRDMRWVTVAQGLIQYCKDDPHHLAVLYPPAHIMDGVLHYLNHPEERTKKYAIYSRFLPGVPKTIRAYRFESGRWKLVMREPIIAKEGGRT